MSSILLETARNDAVLVMKFVSLKINNTMIEKEPDQSMFVPQEDQKNVTQ